MQTAAVLSGLRVMASCCDALLQASCESYSKGPEEPRRELPALAADLTSAPLSDST